MYRLQAVTTVVLQLDIAITTADVVASNRSQATRLQPLSLVELTKMIISSSRVACKSLLVLSSQQILRSVRTLYGSMKPLFERFSHSPVERSSPKRHNEDSATTTVGAVLYVRRRRPHTSRVARTTFVNRVTAQT